MCDHAPNPRRQEPTPEDLEAFPPHLATVTSMAGPVLVYDGDCAMCTASVRWWQRRARRLPTVVAWQMADLERLGLDAQRCQMAVQWVGADREIREGADAVAALMVHAGGGLGMLGRIMGLPGIVHVARVVYRVVARNRHRFPGASTACSLPNASGARPDA